MQASRRVDFLLTEPISPIRVVHDAVTLAGIAVMGPMLPLLTGLDDAQCARVAPVAKRLLASDRARARLLAVPPQ